jgi:hypothetical protein
LSAHVAAAGFRHKRQRRNSNPRGGGAAVYGGRKVSLATPDKKIKKNKAFFSVEKTQKTFIG